jgi:16S rRNA G527 N7-methylase RsmG
MIRVLGIEDLEVLSRSGERIPKFDFVVSRAFGSISKFLKTGAIFLKEDGTVISMKGKRGSEELAQELPILAKMGWIPYFVDPIKLPIVGHGRVLIGLKRDVSRETICKK